MRAIGGRSRPALYKKGSTTRISNIRIACGGSIECQFNAQFTRVWLYAIHAPELAQPGGTKSAENLAATVHRVKPLLMEVVDIDHHGRFIGLGRVHSTQGVYDDCEDYRIEAVPYRACHNK